MPKRRQPTFWNGSVKNLDKFAKLYTGSHWDLRGEFQWNYFILLERRECGSGELEGRCRAIVFKGTVVEWTAVNWTHKVHKVHLRHCELWNMIHFQWIISIPYCGISNCSLSNYSIFSCSTSNSIYNCRIITDKEISPKNRHRFKLLRMPYTFVIWYEGKSNSKVICWNSFSNDYDDAYDLLTSYFSFLRLISAAPLLLATRMPLSRTV